ncbi:MAG: ribonuclease HI family protein [Methanoregulaceae archaeon]|nr:ribonuclease HI family protein [Methanoregulaceae archaeon]
MNQCTTPVSCYTDGASRGNPGPSAYAFILVKSGVQIGEGSRYLGQGTNNSAEYQAIIHGLSAAAAMSCDEIAVFSDSELVIRQILGEYAVRAPHLRGMLQEVRQLSARFRTVTFTRVPRENPWIARADRMCNDILDLEG